jgi:hypothetical protein
MGTDSGPRRARGPVREVPPGLSAEITCTCGSLQFGTWRAEEKIASFFQLEISITRASMLNRSAKACQTEPESDGLAVIIFQSEISARAESQAKNRGRISAILPDQSNALHSTCSKVGFPTYFHPKIVAFYGGLRTPKITKISHQSPASSSSLSKLAIAFVA